MVRLLGEALPTVRLAHRDLARSQQGPEQHRGSFRGRQHSLDLDPPPELFVQSLDRIRRADRFPLALGEAREGEQLVARFLQAISDGLALQAPLADERLAIRLDLLLRAAVEHSL